MGTFTLVNRCLFGSNVVLVELYAPLSQNLECPLLWYFAKRLEEKADNFASRLLIPPNFAAKLSEVSTVEDVKRFAESVGVAPGIVVGRMQHDDLIPHSQWANLIVRYRFADD